MTNYCERDSIQLLQYDTLNVRKLLHFTTTIQGGISEGQYNSLNLSQYAGDRPQHVHQNRMRLANITEVGINNIYVPRQIHEDKICSIDADFLELSDDEKILRLDGVDALMTNQENICIGITTADCVPVLIYDPANKALAAIHAGWKSTVKHIVAKTVQLMTETYRSDPMRLLAAIGPSISARWFEVGDEVGQAFDDNGFDLTSISLRNPQNGKLHIDLQEANKVQLIESGIQGLHIDLAKICTYSNPNLYFSARRQGIESGRMLSGGVIRS